MEEKKDFIASAVTDAISLLSKKLMGERLDVVESKKLIINLCLRKAEELGGYVGGSQRFPSIRSMASDYDIFFNKENKKAYGLFISLLENLGFQQVTETVEKWVTETHKYGGLVRRSQGLFEEPCIGRYIGHGEKFHVALVEKVQSPEWEVENYAKKILKIK